MACLEKWKADFKKPRKVSEKGRQISIVTRLSEDEYELLTAFSKGYSIPMLARGWQCNKSTISRELRFIVKKIIQDGKKGSADFSTHPGTE